LSLAFRPNAFLRPKNETELSRYLKEYAGRARIIAGGTGLYEVAHRGLLGDIEALIDISLIGLTYVRQIGSSLIVGAATTMSDISKSQELQRPELGAIGDCLRAIQPLQVKNVATIGGAVCTALPFLDLPVALLALGARVTISPGERKKDLAEFIKGYFEVDLKEGEFLREIEIPKAAGHLSAFEKFAITHDDWAMINCAASVSLENGGAIKHASVAFGGGLEKATRALATEKTLIGKSGETEIEKTFQTCLDGDIQPVTDIRATADFRMKIAKVIGSRTVLSAVERGKTAK
jgi:aerobic carbon-monoxide dehydrogenase medium subunit